MFGYTEYDNFDGLGLGELVCNGNISLTSGAIQRDAFLGQGFVSTYGRYSNVQWQCHITTRGGECGAIYPWIDNAGVIIEVCKVGISMPHKQ